jgi:asparagine synthase (glutamine-hydrolysing)
MCGIFGQITPQRPINAEACLRATRALAHRGPDGMGAALGRTDRGSADFFLHPDGNRLGRHAQEQSSDLFLGHRRLSVIDLATDAFQPMSNREGTVWVVFNGEIYNHAELRRTLEERGYRFRTDHADTEVLVHGYEAWAEGLVDRLRGMFAFAVLDLCANRLFLARDRFGEKPLYYASNASGVMFASELKALMELNAFDRTLSSQAVTDFLHHGMVPAPRCIFENVRKLRAAERVTIRLDDPARVEPEVYWPTGSPSDGDHPRRKRPAGEWFEAFEAELQESVRLRLASDVPLGAFLSGGLDSTVVTRQMSRLTDRPVRTFSIGFAQKEYDESPWADRVAKHYGTIHHTQTVGAADLLAAVGALAEIFDEPFADSSAVATYLVSRLARRHVTVALSGDGGDELLAGYRRYRVHRRLGKFLDRPWGKAASALLGPVGWIWPESVRGKGIWKLLVSGARRRYVAAFCDPHLVKFLRPERDVGWNCLLNAAWPEDQGMTPIDRMCETDRRFYLPEDLMVKVDRTSMRVSLEARAPLLDHKLFELAARMPLECKFDGARGKLPFRRVLAKELGTEFVERPKRGFAVPLGKWFRDELRDELRDTLLASNGIVDTLFDRRKVRRLVESHQTGSRDQSPRLWKLYMLQKWRECYGRQQVPDGGRTAKPGRAA